MNPDPLDALDYYTLLRVEDGASADRIREAFHAFALRYHPDRHVGSPEKAARAAQIYRRGAEGYRVLMSPTLRRRYDEGLARGELRLSAEAERASKRPPSLSTTLQVMSPRARPFASKAVQALNAGDFQSAKLNLRMALAHEPGNPLLLARLADVEGKLRAG